MELNEALHAALDFEKKGEAVYSSAARKTKNPIVKRTFSYLAEQELNHINEIREYIKRSSITLKGDKPKDTKRFFDMEIQTFREKTQLSDDDIKAHETALGLEQSSYAFYKEQHGKTTDKELKRFFMFLMEQENAHYALIQNAYGYIRDPEGFYTTEEKWVFEG